MVNKLKSRPIMSKSIQLRIILENPYPDVLFGLQKGKGTGYETVQKQTFNGQDLQFDCTATVKGERDESPDFLGDSIQGPSLTRFIYINIGASAGQHFTHWNRRLKVPLRGITWAMIDKLTDGAAIRLETRVNGRGKDGTPSCGTVKPFDGWYV